MGTDQLYVVKVGPILLGLCLRSTHKIVVPLFAG
jgi:hypothetical protein